MSLDEILEDRLVTLKESPDGFVTINGRFAVGDSGLTDRALQDLAEKLLVGLRDDFKRYLEKEVFPDGMSVSHTRVSGGIYDVNAYHKTIEGGLRYSVSVAYGVDGDRTVPTFNISTRTNELPEKIADAVKEYFPIQTKRRNDAVKAHNMHLRIYGMRLNVRLCNPSP